MLELARNTAVALVLCHLNGIVLGARLRPGIGSTLISGVSIGAICAPAMLTPFEVTPGSLLDARTVVLSIAGLFGSPLAAVTAAMVAGAFRVGLGGAGVEIGVQMIIASTALGLVWRRFLGGNPVVVSNAQLLVFGFVVQVATFALWLQLPADVRDATFRAGALPFLAILPPATALLGIHLRESILRARTLRALEESEARLQATVTDRKRDLTERRATEAQLRKLSLAVEQSQNSIVITNVAGDIEYVNAAFVANSGYPSEEAIGRNPRFLQSGRTPKETFDDFWEAMRNGRGWKGVFHNRRKDGSEYVEFAIVSPIRESDGAVTHYLAVKEDITEKTRMGEELDRYRYRLEELVQERTFDLIEARKAADAANRAKSSFVANMSHEIRTPLNAIVGLTYLLGRANPTPQQAEQLSRIDAASAHLLSIIDNILDISKIEAGRLELERRDFHLSALLDDAHSLIAEQARAKGLTVEVDAGDVPNWLRGDPTRLRQALLNYLGNAVKFTPHGRITLRAALLEEKDGKLEICFEVEDTGIGIAAERISAVFDTFEQAEASTARKYGGSGLGLAITRRLARLMGGETGAVSEPGRGSTFWFTAQLEPGHGLLSRVASARIDEVDAELRRRWAGLRVLLVDDTPINREIASEMLQSLGLDVGMAASGREAVDRAREVAHTLILMDVQMPQMDGLEATRRIRALPGRQTTPIVAITASALDEDRRACLAAGMSGVLTKPVTLEALYTALLEWLPRDGCAPVPARTFTAAASAGERKSTLSEWFASIPNLDSAHGLPMVNGDPVRYRRILSLFVDGHIGDAECLEAAIAAGDLKLVGRLAHALLGTASMIGATEVVAAARAVTGAIHGGAGNGEIVEACSALRAALTPLIDALAHAPDGLLAAAEGADPRRVGDEAAKTV